MDVNQSRFQMVLGQSDWGALANGLAYDLASESVGLQPELFIFPPRASEARLSLDQRRGAAVDAFGNHYWIDDDPTQIRYLSRGERVAERFWPPVPTPIVSSPGAFFSPVEAPAARPRRFHGLCVTRDHYMVVGVDSPAGLLLFDLAGGGRPLEAPWPSAIAFEPFDIAAASNGRVWILDRTARRLWSLSSRLGIVPLGPVPTDLGTPPEFAPVDPAAPRPDCFRPEEIRLEHSVLIPAADPISIEALDDGSVLIACDEQTFTNILPYRDTGFDAPVSLADALDALVETGATAVRAYDIARVGSSLFAVGFEGNQAYQMLISADDSGYQFPVQPHYFPMRLFTGKALIGGDSASYDSGDLWPTLAEQPRPRFKTSGFVELPPAGAVFDGREPGCLWHRVFLDACIPAGSSVGIAVRAADAESDLAAFPWQTQPQPYRNHTGSEIPWAASQFDTWELLLQQVRGRFLQMRVGLSGNARETPRIHALRVYYPRFSYLREYLPAIYREDPASASFLDRYLANPEGTLTAIEGRIQDAEILFDSRSCPAAVLEWLASWTGSTFDEDWDEYRKRLFLGHLAQVLAERGTAGGLLHLLRLSLDACPDDSLFASGAASSPQAAFTIRIVESMNTIGNPGVLLGDPSDVAGPGSTASASNWSPAMGAGPLHQRYRTFLQTLYSGIDLLNAAWGRSGADAFSSFLDPQLRLQALAPCQTAERADWTQFVTAAIGFTYMPPGAGADSLYRGFLARLYRQPGDLNQAYGFTGASALASWGDVTPKIWLGRLRQSIPAGGAALRDWIRFVSLILPRQMKAHRFTVLIPVQADDPPQEQQRRAEVARRITEREKPAHTSFDVKLYFALFRVGEARLGLDTLLGPGSRFAAVQLGSQALASGYLGYVPPWSVGGRMVAGRDRLEFPLRR